ncbi:centrobin [Pelodytes ibericus]
MALPHSFSFRDTSLLSGIEPLPLSSPTSPRQHASQSYSPPPVPYSPSTSLRRAASSEVTAQLYASLRRSQDLQDEETGEVPTVTRTEQTLPQSHIMASEADDLAEEMSSRLEEGVEASGRKEATQYISQMESLRCHLQNMMSLNKTGTSYGISMDKREEEESDATSALLHLRPVSPPLSLSGLEGLFPRYTMLYNPAPSLPDLQLRDALEKETARRKHLERHIHNLQNEMLELQQRVTVSLTADHRKDTMIQQLDQTLAIVVGGWKQQERKREETMQRLREEKEAAEQVRLSEQQTLSRLQQELAEALEDLITEKQTAAERQRDLQRLVDKQTVLVTQLQEEKERDEGARVERQRELDTLRLQIKKEQSDWEARERELQEECERAHEERRRELEKERAVSQQESQKSQQWQQAASSLQGDILRLERELQTSHRERDTLQMELNLEKARSESEKVRMESEHKIRLEEAIDERVSAVHEESAQHLSAVREQHRQQLLDLASQHERELSSQLSQFKTELQDRERRHRDAIVECELKLSHAEDRSRELTVALSRLESERAEMLTQLQEVMKSHWSQAVRVLTAKSSESSDLCSSQPAPLQTTVYRDSEESWRFCLPKEPCDQRQTREQEYHRVRDASQFKNSSSHVREASSSPLADGSQFKDSHSQQIVDGSHLGDNRSVVFNESHSGSQQRVGPSSYNESASSDLMKHSLSIESRSQYLVGGSQMKETDFKLMGNGTHFGDQTKSGESGQQPVVWSLSSIDASQFKDHAKQHPTGDDELVISRDISSSRCDTRNSQFEEICNQSVTGRRQQITTGDILSQDIVDNNYFRKISQPLSAIDTSGVEAAGSRPFTVFSSHSVASESHRISQPVIPRSCSTHISGSYLKESERHPMMDGSQFNKPSSQFVSANAVKDTSRHSGFQHHPDRPLPKQSSPGPSYPVRISYGYQDMAHQPSHRAADTEDSFYPMQMEDLSHSFSSHLGFYPLEPFPDGATTGHVSRVHISPEHSFQENSMPVFGRSQISTQETPQNMRPDEKEISPNPLLQYYIRKLLDQTPGHPFSDAIDSKPSNPGASDASQFLTNHPETSVTELCQYLQVTANQRPRSDEKPSSPQKQPHLTVQAAVKKEVLSSQRRPPQTKILKRVSSRGGRTGVWR